MPRHCPIQPQTGSHCKQPLTSVQHDYRHIRGLPSSEIDHHTLLQHDILCHDVFQCNLIDEYVATEIDIDYASSEEDNDAIEDDLDNINDLMVSNWNLQNELVCEETQLFDVNPALDLQNDYDPPAMHSFADWNDRKA